MAYHEVKMNNAEIEVAELRGTVYELNRRNERFQEGVAISFVEHERTIMKIKDWLMILLFLQIMMMALVGVKWVFA